MYKFVTTQLKLNKDDGHIRHQEIQKHFPYGKEVRYRDYGDRVVVQCSKLPITDIQFEMTTVPEYKIGSELKFNILACVAQKTGGKRISIRGVPNTVRWLQRQGGKFGFQILSWEKIKPMGLIASNKGDEHRLHNVVEYQGLLKVVGQELFNTVVGSKTAEHFGLGRAKYAGYGLLDIQDKS